MTPEYRALIESLPAGAVVPVAREDLLRLLDQAGVAELVAPPPSAFARTVDYSVAELSLMFGKAVSTVREWCEQGQFPGAYRRRGREWRVPEAAVRQMQEKEQAAHSSARATVGRPRAGVQTERHTGVLELDSWRLARPA